DLDRQESAPLGSRAKRNSPIAQDGRVYFEPDLESLATALDLHEAGLQPETSSHGSERPDAVAPWTEPLRVSSRAAAIQTASGVFGSSGSESRDTRSVA